MAVTIDRAREAKRKAQAVIQAAGAVSGVGLTRVGASYAVKVNLTDASSIAGLPKVIDGVDIVYEVVGRTRALPVTRRVVGS